MVGGEERGEVRGEVREGEGVNRAVDANVARACILVGCSSAACSLEPKKVSAGGPKLREARSVRSSACSRCCSVMRCGSLGGGVKAMGK